MTLTEAQVQASQCWMKLEVWMTEKGYIWKRLEGADFITDKDRSSDHLVPGLHGLALAQDYALLEKDEETGRLLYLTDSKDYQGPVQYWLTLHPFCRTISQDANHFSFSDHSIPGCTAPNGDLRK